VLLYDYDRLGSSSCTMWRVIHAQTLMTQYITIRWRAKNRSSIWDSDERLSLC